MELPVRWRMHRQGGPEGTVDRIVEMPVQNVTTCTFGGPDLKTLFITSAQHRLAPRRQACREPVFSARGHSRDGGEPLWRRRLD